LDACNRKNIAKPSVVGISGVIDNQILFQRVCPIEDGEILLNYNNIRLNVRHQSINKDNQELLECYNPELWDMNRTLRLREPIVYLGKFPIGFDEYYTYKASKSTVCMWFEGAKDYLRCRLLKNHLNSWFGMRMLSNSFYLLYGAQIPFGIIYFSGPVVFLLKGKVPEKFRVIALKKAPDGFKPITV